MSAARRLLVVAIGLAVGLGAIGPALAHDLKPGVLALVETADGELTLRFVPPIDNRGEVTEITIELPPGCTREAARVHCAHGLTGELAVIGMRGTAMKTLIVIERQDGARQEWMVSADAPRITIGSSPPHGALAWLRLGVEHILGGPDHVAFVIGLLLVLGLALDRRLLLTITAFTLAHSTSLVLAVLGVVAIPIEPVEACIAASIVLVAREATHHEPTAIRRWPWLAAGGFGLIHGLGFASALGQIGLPQGALARSLVLFNVGVELGQLAIVGGVLVLAWLGRVSVGERWIVGPHVHRAACYGLGAFGAWLLLDRVVQLACGGS